MCQSLKGKTGKKRKKTDAGGECPFENFLPGNNKGTFRINEYQHLQVEKHKNTEIQHDIYCVRLQNSLQESANILKTMLTTSKIDKYVVFKFEINNMTFLPT